MKLKLFTQPTCPKCPAAKDVVKQIEHKVKVEHYDIKTEDGLAEALSYNIMATPSIVIIDHDDNVLAEWKSTVPNLEELNKVLK
jgi:glutaredoxin